VEELRAQAQHQPSVHSYVIPSPTTQKIVNRHLEFIRK
jgi:hypothetical protein